MLGHSAKQKPISTSAPICDLLQDVVNKSQCIWGLSLQAKASAACSNSAHHARALSPSTIVSGSSTTQQSWLAIAHDRSIG